MRKTLYISLLVGLLFSCGDKDEEEATPSLEFKDQLLQGKIDEENWSFVTGKAEISTSTISIDLYKESIADSTMCNSFFPAKEDFIFFTMDNTMEVVEFCLVGCDDNSQSVTLYEQTEGSNFIAIEGKIQLTRIDTTAKVVEGKLVTKSGETSYVNGNFTVHLCD